MHCSRVKYSFRLKYLNRILHTFSDQFQDATRNNLQDSLTYGDVRLSSMIGDGRGIEGVMQGMDSRCNTNHGDMPSVSGESDTRETANPVNPVNYDPGMQRISQRTQPYTEFTDYEDGAIDTSLAIRHRTSADSQSSGKQHERTSSSLATTHIATSGHDGQSRNISTCHGMKKGSINSKGRVSDICEGVATFISDTRHCIPQRHKQMSASTLSDMDTPGTIGDAASRNRSGNTSRHPANSSSQERNIHPEALSQLNTAKLQHTDRVPFSSLSAGDTRQIPSKIIQVSNPSHRSTTKPYGSDGDSVNDDVSSGVSTKDISEFTHRNGRYNNEIGDLIGDTCRGSDIYVGNKPREENVTRLNSAADSEVTPSGRNKRRLNNIDPADVQNIYEPPCKSPSLTTPLTRVTDCRIIDELESDPTKKNRDDTRVSNCRSSYKPPSNSMLSSDIKSDPFIQNVESESRQISRDAYYRKHQYSVSGRLQVIEGTSLNDPSASPVRKLRDRQLSDGELTNKPRKEARDMRDVSRPCPKEMTPVKPSNRIGVEPMVRDKGDNVIGRSSFDIGEDDNLNKPNSDHREIKSPSKPGYIAFLSNIA